MVASAVQVAKRTLLATMRAVALSFGMVLTCNRDSSDKDVVVNFRKLALRVHPLVRSRTCHGSSHAGQSTRNFHGAVCALKTLSFFPCQHRAVQNKQLSLAWGRCFGDSASLLRKFMPFQNSKKHVHKIYKIHAHTCIVYMLCDALLV